MYSPAVNIPSRWLLSSLLLTTLLAAPSIEAVDAGETSQPQAVASGGAGDRLRLFDATDGDREQSGARLPLRLTKVLRAPLAPTSDSQRSVLRMEYQLLSALYAQAGQQLAVAEKVRRLEGALAELQERDEGRNGPPDAMLSALADRPVARPPAAAEARRQPPSPDSRTLPPPDGKNAWWPEVAVLFAAIAAVTWLLRRRAVRVPLPVMAATAERSFDTSDDSGWELQTLPSIDGPAELSERPQAAVRREPAEVAAVLELAEIMITFGRAKGAEQALEEFVAKHPSAALAPWLKLLEVYRRNGQRPAFEATGMKLAHYFNVSAADWDAAGALLSPVAPPVDPPPASIEQLLPRLPAIGRLPHITSEVARTWGSPGCLAYLDRLLRDNRNGQRRGFALVTVRELLLLTNVMESRLAPLS
ncbi:MAG: hypothetical protein IAE88_13420 [Rhodobacteraceae bacterium]|nr:hypothetical protein [Paracoccaceae bacterium]